jgi:hypothetical protein
MADNGVNVKMGVSGLSQFKNNMNQAKQAVKTLDAQLALTEKQFKASGDAESYMTEKSELLKAKLEQQKTVLANAEKALQDMADKGVDRSSKAYQDMYRQMLQAKGALLDTENEMNGVTDAADKASDGVSEMNAQLSRIGQGVSWENVTSSLDKITGGMEAVIKKAWNMGKAIVNATLGAGSWADELATTAAQYEIEPEHLYRMRETARLIDTDADTILSAQDKLRKGMEKGEKNAMGALAYLGIDPNGKSNLDVFWEAGEAIAQLGSEEDKVAYANALFGKSWRELVPLFQSGRDEYDETMGQWSWIGDDAFENLTKMDDAYQQLESEWDAFQKKFEAAMAPAMTQTMDVITGLLQEFNDYLSSEQGQEMLQAMGDAVSGLISDLANIDPEKVMEGVKGVFDDLINGFKWLAENKETVLGFIKGFGIAWAGLKGLSVITNVLKLVNGIKGLTAGSAAAAGQTAGASWAGAFASAAMKAAPFLAFLYTLLNPSEGKDALGNNDLIDENGDLTPEAEAYGLKKDENGEIYQDPFAANPKYVDQDFLKWQQEQAGKPKTLAVGTNSDGERAIARHESILALQKLQEATADLTGGSEAQKQSSSEMTAAAGKLDGLPGVIEQAILDGMAQVQITIDGQTAGEVLTPYVAAGMGGKILMVTK